MVDAPKNYDEEVAAYRSGKLSGEPAFTAGTVESPLPEACSVTPSFRILRTLHPDDQGGLWANADHGLQVGDKLQQAHVGHRTGTVKWEDIPVHLIKTEDDPHV